MKDHSLCHLSFCAFGWLLACAFGMIPVAPYTSVALCADANAESQSVDFAGDVYPILQRSCFECHGAEKQAGGLRLDLRSETLDSGTIEPGAPQESELLRRVMLPKGHDEIMPAVGDPLADHQVELLRRWVQQGARWPEDFQAKTHWAYVAPERPIPPAVNNRTWPRTPLDQIVLRRLEAEGIEPSEDATAEKQIRRVYLDLIGLPPSPQETDAFVNDPSDTHYREIVDDLLGRPQFGERWARPWLDLARYADSHGFQRDNFRDIWAYRDWVIRALNADMPFDQFTIEQVAGDLLPDATESQRIATGFHRCTPTNVEAGSLPEETRIEQVIDRVNTTGAVWLGTTLECCQCHDHKYDPFSAKEYYQLLAYFNNTQMEADRTNPKTPSSIQFKGPTMNLPHAQRDAERAALQAEIKAAKQRQTQLRRQASQGLANWMSELAQAIEDAPKTHPMKLSDFQSLGTTDSYELLDDGSILLQGGDPPAKDVYQLIASVEAKDVTAVRIDVLVDDSLPEKGPGRNNRRNFVLNEFQAQMIAPATEHDRQPVSSSAPTTQQNLRFVSATASFSQKKWKVDGAIDGDPKTGWAISPKQGKPHWATFVLDRPIDLSNGRSLAITMSQQFGRALTIGRFKLSAITGKVGGEAISELVVSAAGKKTGQWSKQERAAVVDFRLSQNAEYADVQTKIDQMQKKVQSLAPDTTLVMIELDEPRMSTVFNRGDYRTPGEGVQPGTPSVLHPVPSGPGNRLTLARWLVSRDNPVVARVTVNRWWAELFGSGIVPTVEDFGIKGEPPSHPELLDYLAVEFMDSGWSMKQLLKTIVISSTYRQSSNVRYELQEVDPENRLLARGPRFRMDAEMIRDNALAISGLLNLKQFGPSIRPFQPDGIWSKVGGESYAYEVSPGNEQHRRGVYVVIKRGSPYPSLINFDATARLACTVKRSRTNTPLQALTLLNDPVYVEAATAFSQRVQRECQGRSVEEKLSYAFQLCTGRQPQQSELATLVHLHRQQSDASDPYYGVASALMNLHETITKD